MPAEHRDGPDVADLEGLVRGLGLAPESADVWRHAWPRTQARFHSGASELFAPARISGFCARLGMSAEITAAFRSGATLIVSDPALVRLAWHCHCMLYEQPGVVHAAARSWPMLPRDVGEGVDLFYGLVFLSGLPCVERLHREHGVAWEVTRDTLSDLELWVLAHHSKHGVWGFSEHKWLVHHVAANLFKIGRLQFQFGTFRYGYRVFRHVRSGRVVMLAGDGMTFDPATVGNGQAGDAPWAATLHMRGALVVGSPVSPCGTVQRTTVSLPLAEWQTVLQQGDATVNLHIPGGEPMTHAACGAAFRQAVAFFAESFPGFAYGAFVCGSWLLDPQFEAYLGDSSNIVRFMRELFLFPIPGTDDSATLARVLGGRPEDLDNAPQHTSMQRAVVRHMREGGHWRASGGLLLTRDLNWGACVYRARHAGGTGLDDRVGDAPNGPEPAHRLSLSRPSEPGSRAV